MASAQELSDFLSSVEQRAFKQAVYAVRDDDAAMDIVQDAMIKLAEKYGDKPAAELPLLFTRILQNRIHDWFRRQKVRNAWVTLFSSLGRKAEESDDFDPLESLSAPIISGGAASLFVFVESLLALVAKNSALLVFIFFRPLQFSAKNCLVCSIPCFWPEFERRCYRKNHFVNENLGSKPYIL